MDSTTAPRSTTRTLLVAAALCAAASAQCPVLTADGFEGGINKQGWSFNVTVPEVIEHAGGNPGAWLRNSGIQSFAPILTNDPAAPGTIAGDFRALGVTRISFDARTDGRGFGQPAGFAMSLLLRDTKGTGNVNDDDYAYFVGPEVPQIGAGWKSFSFPVPSQSTVALPPGWTGGSPLNPTRFRPGVNWNDVITSVDVVEFWWIDPSFFAIIVGWDVGVDNVVFEQTLFASATSRNGSGINPLTLSPGTLPVVGAVWRTDLDCSAHGAGLAALFASPGPSQGLVLPFGEILFDPNGALVLASLPASGGTTSFPFTVPNNPALCGAAITAQGLCTGPPSLQLSNALDLVFGQ